ncbi:MAG: hypothetical protein WCH61_03025, partial [bacterium]
MKTMNNPSPDTITAQAGWKHRSAGRVFRSLHCNSRDCSQPAKKLRAFPFSQLPISINSDLFRVSGFGFRISGPAGLRPLCLFATILLLSFSLQPSAFSQDSICARVRIEILQELTLEREAFEARMTINNGTAAPLDNVSVDVSFADKNGN